jgi:hypothetical protein
MGVNRTGEYCLNPSEGYVANPRPSDPRWCRANTLQAVHVFMGIKDYEATLT